jgi:hypothetical protein
VTGPHVWTEPTAYTVCAVPETVEEWEIFAITVERTAPGRWAIRRRSRCLDRDGAWVHESIPSERSDDFLERCRFDLDTALDMARQVAPTLRSNGITAERAAVEWAEERDHG